MPPVHDGMHELTPERIRECIEEFLSGRVESFEPLYRAYRDRLYRVAAGRLGDGADAEDCVQEAFVRAARYLRSYDPARPFWSWLVRILTNRATDRLRTRWADRLLAEDEIAGVPAPPPTATDAERLRAVADQDDRAKMVHAALAELPEDHRKRVLLFYVNGLSHAELIRIFGDPSEEASRQKMRRIREALKARLDPGRAKGIA